MTDFPVVLIGDLHGRFDLLRKILLATGLIGPDGHWTGGKRRLVQTGDVLDRGPQSLAALDLLMTLQAEARAAGGEVVCLLGNHEAMALAAAAGDHEDRMLGIYNGANATYAEWLVRQGRLGDPSDPCYPEGFFASFAPGSHYGDWLRSHRVAVPVGDYIAVHAGWPPAYTGGVAQANAAYAATPRDAAGARAAFRDPEHPLSRTTGLLWVRRQTPAELEESCRSLGCRGLIAGHTVTYGIKVSCAGRLIQIDVGMCEFGTWGALGMDNTGRLWALLEGQQPICLGADGLIPLPAGQAPVHQAPRLPRFWPGDLVRLYRSADGTCRMYLQVWELGQAWGMPAYRGTWVTYAEGQWSVGPGAQVVDRVDQFGRLAHPGEVPAEVLSVQPEEQS